jgi:purine-binding chemotaxis protein CheW
MAGELTIDGARTGPAAGASGAAGPGRTTWLLCRAGTQLCAIPLEHVIETMRVLQVERVSGAPLYVLGLAIIRGAPVPVVDTGLLVGDRATRAERLITVRTGNRTIALAAEAVLGVATLAPDRLAQLPPLLRDAAAVTIEAVGTLDAELLFFLRAARIMPDELFDRLEFERALS